MPLQIGDGKSRYFIVGIYAKLHLYTRLYMYKECMQLYKKESDES